MLLIYGLYRLIHKTLRCKLNQSCFLFSFFKLLLILTYLTYPLTYHVGNCIHLSSDNYSTRTEMCKFLQLVELSTIGWHTVQTSCHIGDLLFSIWWVIELGEEHLLKWRQEKTKTKVSAPGFVYWNSNFNISVFLCWILTCSLHSAP